MLYRMLELRLGPPYSSPGDHSPAGSLPYPNPAERRILPPHPAYSSPALLVIVIRGTVATLDPIGDPKMAALAMLTMLGKNKHPG